MMLLVARSTSSTTSRMFLGYLLLYLCVLAGSKVGRVLGSPLSQERYQVTTFGAERRARWSLEGKTAVVTGGTKVCGMIYYRYLLLYDAAV